MVFVSAVVAEKLNQTKTLNQSAAMKPLTFILFLFVAINSNGQNDHMHAGIGLGAGTLNANSGISSGFSFYIGRDIFKTKNSSFSICTNYKIGTEDKTGLVFPLTVAYLYLIAASGNDASLQNVDLSGFQVKFFTELPLLFHYNFGLGSNKDSEHKFGFYFGGGMSYTLTGYTDTAKMCRELLFLD
jgi:opacity protein-like surface antigen